MIRLKRAKTGSPILINPNKIIVVFNGLYDKGLAVIKTEDGVYGVDETFEKVEELLSRYLKDNSCIHK